MRPRVKVKASSRWVAEVVRFETPVAPYIERDVQEIMDRVQSGSVCAIAIVAIGLSGNVTTCFQTNCHDMKLLGSLDVVRDRILHRWRLDDGY